MKKNNDTNTYYLEPHKGLFRRVIQFRLDHLTLPEDLNVTTDADAIAAAIQRGKDSVNDFGKSLGLGGEWCPGTKQRDVNDMSLETSKRKRKATVKVSLANESKESLSRNLSCNCKGLCDTNRCRCRKVNKKCNEMCHTKFENDNGFCECLNI